MTDTEAYKIGQQLIDLLNLKPVPFQSKSKIENLVYFDTSWGVKTVEGLGRCVMKLTASKPVG